MSTLPPARDAHLFRTGADVRGRAPHEDAALGPQKTSELLYGVIVSVASSWVDTLHYDRPTGTLTVTTRSGGGPYETPGVPVSAIQYLAEAPSKGAAVNKLWDTYVPGHRTRRFQ